MGTTTDAAVEGWADPRTKQDKSAAQATQVARAIGRILWEHDFDATYPAATAEEKHASWQEARQQYVRLGRTVQQRLRRRGFVIEAPDAAGLDGEMG